MKIARGADGAFLFRDENYEACEADSWVSADSVGIHGGDLAELIAHLPRLVGTVAAATPNVHSPRLGAPMGRPGKILAVGLNYLRHIEEVGKPQPEVPMIFAKYPSAVTGPEDYIELDPALTAELDYEVELAVVIGTPARHVKTAMALDHVLGYCVANDVSARDIQRTESQVSRSKGFDTFCPIGPWITTWDEIADPHDLRITTTVNTEVRQDSTTSDLLFNVPYLVAYLSQTMTLETGDVILTGTPSGVASGMRSPKYLEADDVVRCEIEGLGHLENLVVQSKAG